MIENSITNWLEQQVKALPNQQISVYYYSAPHTARMPFVVLDTQHASDNWPIAGGSISQVEFEVICYHQSAPLAVQLGKTIKGIINNIKATQIGGHFVTLARVTNEFDTDESQSQSHARNMVYLVNYMRD